MTPTDDSGHSRSTTQNAAVFTFAELVTAAERLGKLAERARFDDKHEMADHLEHQAQEYRALAVDTADRSS